MHSVPMGLKNDTPTVKNTLKSPDKDRSLAAINEEFETLQEVNNFNPCNCPETSDIVLPAGTILKLNYD